jgi:DNA-dependent protein kinase catalytic subunit
LTHPHLRFLDAKKLVLKEFKLKNQDLADQHLKALRESVCETNWNFVGNEIGTWNIEFAKVLQSNIGKILASKHVNQSVIDCLEKEAENLRIEHSSGKVPLSVFSQWLSTFDPTSHCIEIPGSYINLDREPTVEDRELILSVDQTLLVMDSIRKPKRIVFYGNSGKVYKFLVKGGEDLRTDERIQSLFSLMNDLLSPKSEKLQAKTFKVIPMTIKLGILEWVKNTSPLKSFIVDEMALDSKFRDENSSAFKGKNVDLFALKASSDRLKWIKDNTYHENYVKVNSLDAFSLWESIQKKIPQDFLRRRFAAKCHSAESFLSYRAEFVRSFAVSSMYCYICGVGDRHLDNLLVDSKSGTVVQIDFDMCFGKGTFLLPVPELIPFRLTPQIMAVLQPLDLPVLIRRYMVSVMSILRTPGSIKSLSNALEIYLNDPVSDWIKSEKERQDIENLKESETWEPKRRIQSTLRYF